MKKGLFSPEEIKKIRKSLLQYAFDHNFTESQLIDLIMEKQKKSENSPCVSISECLTDRSFQSIHILCNRIFNANIY